MGSRILYLEKIRLQNFTIGYDFVIFALSTSRIKNTTSKVLVTVNLLRSLIFDDHVKDKFPKVSELQNNWTVLNGLSGDLGFDLVHDLLGDLKFVVLHFYPGSRNAEVTQRESHKKDLDNFELFVFFLIRPENVVS